ncbi:hypothetical protein PPO43_10285 [Saprospira sp. CCB-QB6]|uniref:hypothetical protein n=1 Tax=Saprospira sp. CCB-QB6 TaxID=3023936 RepID=UPI0023492E40|nr:hypothetical protein [Saprospira sp. CCB-QB6]WCL80362.1 hypothetical protein PPO43_10285 [Saprospira sp. CCB-QB6]
MKYYMLSLIFALFCILPNQQLQAASSAIDIGNFHQETVLGQGKGQGKKLTKKQKRQKLRKLRKKYRKEMKGLSKAEKQAFLLKKLNTERAPEQTQLDIPMKNLLLLGILLVIIGALFGLLDIGLLASIFGFIGALIIIIWLILLILEHL